MRAHRSWMTFSLAVVATAVLVPAAGAQQPYFPGKDHEWERRAPQQVGMDPTLVRRAVEVAIAGESQSPRDLAANHQRSFGQEPHGEAIGPFKMRGDMTGVIIKDGYIVAEWGEPDRVDMTFSVTKTFLSTTVGLAYDRGMIREIHDRVKDYVPTDHFDSEHNSQITWDHLLRQTSDWEGTLWAKPDWADRPTRNTDIRELMNRDRPPPGTTYKYNDVRVNVLALATLHVWRRPLPQVLREHVMDPIGASNKWRWHGYENSWVNVDGAWVQSVSGGGHWGGGMFLTAFDQARLGLLTLHRGRWAGTQILSDEWITMALTPGAVNDAYGFMNYFLNTGQRMLPSAPESAFMHRGAGSNLVYVDPEHDLVIVCRWIRGSVMDDVVGLVIRSLGDAETGGG